MRAGTLALLLAWALACLAATVAVPYFGLRLLEVAGLVIEVHYERFFLSLARFLSAVLGALLAVYLAGTFTATDRRLIRLLAAVAGGTSCWFGVPVLLVCLGGPGW